MKVDAEVGVVGVGTMGSMALWQLARRGISCLGLEQYRVGHELGAGAGETRQFRANYLEPEVHAVMAEAVGEYRRLEADSGLPLLTITGGLTIGPAGSELIDQLLERIRTAGDEPCVLSYARMKERYPQHRLADDDVVVWNAETGFVRPEHAILAASTTARRLGARIHENSAVVDIERGSGYVRLRTPDRVVTVRRAIVTAGAWAWQLLPAIPGTHVGRLLLTWFGTAHGDAFSMANSPTFTRSVEGITIYGMPSLSPGTVRVGLVGPRSRFTDPDALDRVFVPKAEIESITGLVSRWLPDLIPQVIRAGTYMDAYTPDGQPIVGPLDPSGDVVVAAGFCGRGFKMAPVVGRILADVAVDGRSQLDIRSWQPNRFAVSSS